MRFLIDTHVFLWWLIDDARLSDSSQNLISNPENAIFVSSASAWEIAIKFRLGKLPGARAMVNDIPACIANQGFKELAITAEDGQRAGLLETVLRDPFDRMLIAQSQNHGLVLITKDQDMYQKGVDTVW
ncbi:MAG: type II toxin-antitoxin system VapC family toxin [Acidiferrobacterales bacterium]|nr:type II toxin-antitoxin system VapC family toxin [Acidiferrobacterales bacterium]